MSTVEALKRYLYVSNTAERFELRASDEPSVRRILLAGIARPDARAEMKAVLRLLVALELHLESPKVAEQLRGWMRATPELHPTIRSLGFQVGGLDATRNFQSREGRQTGLRAPQLGARPPRGAVPLRDLLRPSARPRRC